MSKISILAGLFAMMLFANVANAQDHVDHGQSLPDDHSIHGTSIQFPAVCMKNYEDLARRITTEDNAVKVFTAESKTGSQFELWKSLKNDDRIVLHVMNDTGVACMTDWLENVKDSDSSL